VKTLSIMIAVSLAACSSKHDAPPDPAPAAPPAQALVTGPHGVAMQGIGSSSVLVDTVGGYRIAFPDTPTIEEDPMETPRGTRPGVLVTLGVGAGALFAKIHRLQPGDYDRANPDPSIETLFDTLRHEDVAQISDEVVTLAGLHGRKFVGKKSIGDDHAELRLWSVIDPAHDTAYYIMVVVPDGTAPDPAFDHFAESFSKR
jgi:hypothetical protein